MPCHEMAWHVKGYCMHAYFTNSKVNCFLPPFETIPPQSIFSIMGIADLMCSNNAAGNHCKGKRQQQISKATWNVIWLMIDIKQQWWAPTEWVCSPYNPELFFRRKKKNLEPDINYPIITAYKTRERLTCSSRFASYSFHAQLARFCSSINLELRQLLRICM